MKHTLHRMPGLQTLGRPAVVMILGFVLAPVIAYAQKDSPLNADAAPGKSPAVPAKPTGDAGKKWQKIFPLQNGSAVAYEEVLKKMFPEPDVIIADPRTNSIVVASAGQERLDEILAFLQALDQLPSKPAASDTDPYHPGHGQGSPRAGQGAAVDVNPSRRQTVEAPQARGIRITSVSRQLVEKLQAQESAGAAEAAAIRQLQANGQAEQNKLATIEHQRKLSNLLSTAFDLKLKLEELQVKELQARLSRLEHQLGQRKQLRDKIIARRASELIESNLNWTPKVPPTMPTNGVESLIESDSHTSRTQTTLPFIADTTQIHFTGPSGMKIQIDATSDVVVVPGRHNFPRDKQQTRDYPVTIQWTDEMKYAATLDVYPADPKTAEYLHQHSVPLGITGEDVGQVTQRNTVTKVVYLPDSAHQDLAIASCETLVSTRLDPGTDPIREADRLGTIFAVLRFHTLLGIPSSKSNLDSAAAAALVWEHLGLKLSAPADSKDLPPRYRGGLIIVDVDEHRSAFNSGIRKGDILVGLSIWETRSLDDLLYILRNAATQPKAGLASGRLKAFLVRKGETLFTEFEFGEIIPTKTKLEASQP